MINVKKGWIVSPTMDLIFVFGGSLLAVLILILSEGPFPVSFSKDLSLITLFFIMFALNGGHMVAGLFLLLTNRNERSRAQTIDPKIYTRCILIFIVSVVIFAIAAILFSNDSQTNAFKIPIKIAGFIYFIWNGWHFAMQQFGLLQVYRKKNGLVSVVDRHLDRVQCLFFISLIPSLLLFSNGKNDDFFASDFGSLQWLTAYRAEIFVFAALMACLAIARLSLQRHWRWQIALCYAGLFFIPVAMSFNPVIFLFLAVLGPHYLQEIFLITSIDSVKKTGETATINLKKLLFRLIGFVFASASFYLIIELSRKLGGSIGIFGGVHLENGISSSRFFAIAGLAAIFATFNFYHFYLDRIIFTKRSEIL